MSPTLKYIIVTFLALAGVTGLAFSIYCSRVYARIERERSLQMEKRLKLAYADLWELTQSKVKLLTKKEAFYERRLVSEEDLPSYNNLLSLEKDFELVEDMLSREYSIGYFRTGIPAYVSQVLLEVKMQQL